MKIFYEWVYLAFSTIYMLILLNIFLIKHQETQLCLLKLSKYFQAPVTLLFICVKIELGTRRRIDNTPVHGRSSELHGYYLLSLANCWMDLVEIFKKLH